MTRSTENTMEAAPPASGGIRVLLASLAGTTIEFFDFYIYATAAVLVFPRLFFPQGNALAATLQSLATFALAFFARPVGSVLFGHFGDRLGRKATLIAALLTMGLSTVIIGLLPSYESIGIAAPLLLALCRLGQGIGLGGEWAGAVLMATENAPPGKRAWYGMFPQLGAPLGFLCSGVIFLLLSLGLSESQFLVFGWRFPFVASSVLILLGLYVRLKITETPVFLRARQEGRQEQVPMLGVLRHHLGVVVLGTLSSLATFVIFYLLTVFCLSWGTTKMGYTRNGFLLYQLVGILFFGATIPLSAHLADRHGRRITMILISAGIMVFGFMMPFLFAVGTTGVVTMFILGFALMGLTYGPLGTLLSELYPVAVRYTGASVSFSMAGILGASLAPYAATWLASSFGLPYVGYYLSAMALVSLIALFGIRETRDRR